MLIVSFKNLVERKNIEYFVKLGKGQSLKNQENGNPNNSKNLEELVVIGILMFPESLVPK